MILLVTLVTLVIAAITFAGCFKGDNLDENKIMAPVPNNLDIYGTWEVTSEYAVGSNDTLKNVDNIKKEYIVISKNNVIVGDMNIDNPVFKFKRVSKDTYLPNAFDSVVKDIPLDSGYMNIISISDNTNLYIDFIIKNKDEAYIYAFGDLLQIKRVSNSTQIAPESATSSSTTAKVSQNSGVLLGMKTPAILDGTNVIKSASYKTYWISMVDGKLKDTEILNGIVLPRINGTFSDVNTSDKVLNGKSIQNMEVVNYNKNGSKTVEQNDKPLSDNRQITFASKDYLGMEYYNPTSNDTEYNISTIDSINSGKILSITSLFGSNGEKQYNASKQQFIDGQPSFVIDKYNLKASTSNDITMFRKNGKWVVESNIESDIVGVNDLSFDVNVSPVGTLVNYDSLPVSWNKIRQIDDNATDAFASPSGNFIVIVNNNSIEIHEMDNGNINKNSIRTIPIDKGEVPVMGEWATGDFVSLWNKSVEEKIK